MPSLFFSCHGKVVFTINDHDNMSSCMELTDLCYFFCYWVKSVLLALKAGKTYPASSGINARDLDFGVSVIKKMIEPSFD